MNLLARILSHGFAIAIVLLLALGLIYRGELFPDWKLPEFLSLGTPTENGETTAAPGVTPKMPAVEPISETVTPVATGDTAPAVTQADESAAIAESPMEAPATAPVETPEVVPAAAPVEVPEVAPAAAPVEIPAETPATAPVESIEDSRLEATEETPAVTPVDMAGTAAPAMFMAEPAVAPEEKATVAAVVTQPAATMTETVVPVPAATTETTTAAAVVASEVVESVADTSGAAVSEVEGVQPEAAVLIEDAAVVPTAVVPEPMETATPAEPEAAALPVMTGSLVDTPPAAVIDTSPVPGLEAPTGSTSTPAAPQEPSAAPVHEHALAEPAALAPAAIAPQPETVVPDEPQPPVERRKAPPKAKSYEVLAAAREAYWLRDYDMAESKYLQLTIMEPDNPDSYGELGNMYFSQGQWDKAASAYFDAGMRLVKEGQLEQAQQLVDVIRGLDGAQADELNKQIVAAEAATH